MNFQEIIVAGIVFWAVYYLGNRFFKKKKKDTDCNDDCGDNCHH